MSVEPRAVGGTDSTAAAPWPLTPEQARAARFSYGLVQHGTSARRAAFALRHPRGALAAHRFAAQLPVVDVALSTDPAGRTIRESLLARVVGRPAGLVGRPLLLIDPTGRLPGGRRLQAFRTNCRRAEGVGVSVVVLTHEQERREALAALSPDAPSPALLRAECWLLARSRTGEPLALSIADVDRHWALLRVFVSAGRGESGAARYLLHRELVRRLAAVGVLGLCVDKSYLARPLGVLYLQHLLGFAVARVRPVPLGEAA